MTTHKIMLAAPPSVIQIRPGDRISADIEFDYIGPACSGARARVAMFSWTAIDPRNEKAFQERTFDIPNSPGPGNHITIHDIILQLPTSGLPAGLLYGLYVKVFNVVGKEYFHYIGEKDPPYYQWIIEVLSAVSEISNLKISSYAKV